MSALASAVPNGRLEARGLQKSYGPRRVVKDVHLAVGAGEVSACSGRTAPARQRAST
jgi:lipopolysaccharide export system ATP-binding protein